MIAASLVGKKLPSIALPSTGGQSINLASMLGQVVIVIYPYTGRPNHSDPDNWDQIIGAHGSTPQLLNYSMLYNDFTKRNTKIFGVSQLSAEWQSDFVRRNNLKFELLSDENLEFARLLNLQSFETGGKKYLTRVTLIATDSLVTHIRGNITFPASDAEDVLKQLK